MSARYAPLPNPQTDPLLNDELEAAFEEDDDDDDNSNDEHSESLYDFENFDYASFPPPGSPPRPSSSALPNDFGNSNGLIPSPSDVLHVHGSRANWFRRTARTILPNSLIHRLQLDYEPTPVVVGGGTNNDGVFANVTAKPSRPVLLRDGDDVYLVPEESQKDAPPSYTSAQADAVPPYWETTVHAPSSSDDMIIDHLPTGSVFSFLWNLLISISFQFVGFLLTYLLHTTHAARFGSRAGLGVTLIQYGFALRSRPEDDPTGNAWWGVGGGPYGNGMQDDIPAKPTFVTKEEAEEYYRKLNITMVDGMPSGTVPGATMDDMNFANEATTDWLSFFLMTIGWFILLTSLLSFWRVKRWERNILASQRDPTTATRDAAGPSHSFSMHLHRFVSVPMRDMSSLLRSGLSFSRRPREDAESSEHDEDVAEEGGAVPLTPITPSLADETSRREMIIAMYAHDPDRQRQIIQAFRDDDQLMSDMRAAGML
ncbi:hypothetical protein B0F90DRAFT_1807943 [Multifurca ochricompacta]|uniref:Metal homeostatis protein bsd2 n=1 Tax=Multifurca ochricompacta TaxID=376703 RepID=A0AAD4MBG6_9AGAM|nr:hypothetical protein B0F90DRAFT_1807943 [Multifurca ochricompacta]